MVVLTHSKKLKWQRNEWINLQEKLIMERIQRIVKESNQKIFYTTLELFFFYFTLLIIEYCALTN